MATFYKGNKNDFLKILKIPYGFILVEFKVEGFLKTGAMVFENANDFSIIHLEQGEALIKICGAKGHINPKEISQVRKGMAKHRLLKNMSEIMDVVRNFKLPANFHSRYNFALCGQNDGCSFPLKHGYIQTEDGQQLSPDNARRLDEAFLTFNFLANNPETKNTFSPYGFIFLLQQMIKAGLPIDEEGYLKNYNDLSEEEKLVLESPAALREEEENENKDGNNGGGNLPN